MGKKMLYTVWGAAYVLCAGLGFIPEPTGFGKAVLVLLSLLFFLPGGWLLYGSAKSGDRTDAKRIRNLSLIWLSVTLVLLVGNLLSAMAPEWVGNVLYVLLVLLSSPMICSRYWVLVLFGWACLLMVSLSLLRKK